MKPHANPLCLAAHNDASNNLAEIASPLLYCDQRSRRKKNKK